MVVAQYIRTATKTEKLNGFRAVVYSIEDISTRSVCFYVLLDWFDKLAKAIQDDGQMCLIEFASNPEDDDEDGLFWLEDEREDGEDWLGSYEFMQFCGNMGVDADWAFKQLLMDVEQIKRELNK
jgi:hypothetical protein